MATELDPWQMDPFYSAAEEVQNSADRMESAYRTWKHVKTLLGASRDTTALCFVDARRLDLITALDTVKWQLEEFERAFELSVLTERVYVEEKAALRYQQFVRAIRSQILSLTSELGDITYSQTPQSAGNNLQEKDTDDFADFLLGGECNKSTGKNGVCIHPPGLHQPHQDGHLAKKSVIEPWGICEPPFDGYEIGNSLVEKFDQPMLYPHHKINGTKEDATEEDYASSEFSTTTSEGKFDAKDRHFSLHYASSEFSTSTSEGHLSHSPAHSIDMEMGAPHDTKKVGKLGILSGFCRFWKNKESGKFQVSRSGFKKWKDGDADFEGYCDNSASCGFNPVHKICLLGSGQDLGDDRSSESPKLHLSDYPLLDFKDSNAKFLCGFQGIIQGQQHSGIRQGFSADCSPKMLLAVFTVLMLAVLYFWFISTFLPVDSSNLPGEVFN